MLAAQAAAIAAMQPGARWNAPHDAAVRVLAQGMIDLGLCQRQRSTAVIENGDYRRFYMHRTGHWLGLDVHDAGDYKRDGEWRALEPGMVLTVEPGCYIRPGDGVPEAVLEHRHPHRGRCAGDRRRLRSHYSRRAQDRSPTSKR